MRINDLWLAVAPAIQDDFRLLTSNAKDFADVCSSTHPISRHCHPTWPTGCRRHLRAVRGMGSCNSEQRKRIESSSGGTLEIAMDDARLVRACVARSIHVAHPARPERTEDLEWTEPGCPWRRPWQGTPLLNERLPDSGHSFSARRRANPSTGAKGGKRKARPAVRPKL